MARRWWLRSEQPTGTPGRIGFDSHIFPAELEEIARRRSEVLGYMDEGLAEARKERRSRVLRKPPPLLGRLLERWRPESAAEDGIYDRLVKNLSRRPRTGPLTAYRGTAPSSGLGLVGLALSGGGIRSATFCLGAVQALVARGVFPLVDYLSTVSGGGYLGSCLSSLLADGEGSRWNQQTGEGFPLGYRQDSTDRPALRHLRNSGHYLATGLVDSVRIPALLLRGILIHWVVLLPYVVASVWLTDALVGESLRAAAKTPALQSPWAAIAATRPRGFWGLVLIAVAAYVGWVLVSPVFQWWGHRSATWGSKRAFATRNLYERSFGLLLLLVAGIALFQFLPTALSYYHHYLSAPATGGIGGSSAAPRRAGGSGPAPPWPAPGWPPWAPRPARRSGAPWR